MGIPRKGSRPICVQGINYRWLVRKKATYSQVDYGIGYLHVAITLEENQGTVLVIFTNHKHPLDVVAKEIIPVIPSIVSSWILEALNLGWQPENDGSQFHVRISEDGRMIKI